MRGKAHAGPMAQYSSGSGRTIYNINIGPGATGTVDISSTQKIVCKVPLHIFASGSTDGQVRADPIADSRWKRVQRYRQGNGGLNNELEVRCHKAVGYAGGYQ